MHLKISTPVSLILVPVTVVLCRVCGAAEIHHLQKLQNRAARIIIVSNCDATIKPLIESLSWKTINEMIQFESRAIVFKSLNRFTSQYLLDLFVAKLHQSLIQPKEYGHRSYITKENTSTGQTSFLYRGAELWNSLPDPSNRASSLISFKSLL